jgi:uncharacterized membrane protein YuzA (DUF378 family)
MDIKTIAAAVISVIGSLLAGFGLASADQIATLTSELTAAVGAIVGIVGFVSTVFLHKKAVDKAAAAPAPTDAPKA